MNKNNSSNIDKRSIIMISATFAAVLAVLLVILLVPGLRYKEKTYKDTLLEQYLKLNDSTGCAAYITENGDLYSEEILDIYNFSREYPDELSEIILNFIRDYPEHKDDYASMSFTDAELNSGEIPAFYMYDRRWGYEKIGGNFIATDGCAAVAMTMTYAALTHRDDVNPVTVARIAETNGYLNFMGGIDTSFTNNICASLGLQSVTHCFMDADPEKNEPLNEQLLKDLIDRQDRVIFAAMSGETFGGHAVILRGYDENGFYINDPANEYRTNQCWDYSVFENEMAYCWEIYV